MARIAGINLPNGKHIWIALTAIYGIGPTRANKICSDAGVDKTKKVKDLDEKDLEVIRNFIDKYQLEGDLRTSGSIDVAGLINGNIFVSEMTVKETGSIRGTVEATSIEINGHVEGKITADVVIVGKTAVIKGDILFKNSLRTEEGADIEGYIKRMNNGKSNSEEDIAIEEIVERSEIAKKPNPIHVVQQKKSCITCHFIFNF